jgi:hypothetical protein
MIFVILFGVSAGSAVFTVLDGPFARDRRRHARRCRFLLTLSIALLLTVAAVAAGGRLATDPT